MESITNIASPNCTSNTTPRPQLDKHVDDFVRKLFNYFPGMLSTTRDINRVSFPHIINAFRTLPKPERLNTHSLKVLNEALGMFFEKISSEERLALLVECIGHIDAKKVIIENQDEILELKSKILSRIEELNGGFRYFDGHC